MKVVIQRVSEASVTVNDEMVAQIAGGLLLFVGIEEPDNEGDVDWLASKVANLRIFADANGAMNLSVKDVKGEIIVVSQFTLHALTKKGNRPSYIKAARPEQAVPVYESFISSLTLQTAAVVQSGIFGADMKIRLLNDGPVTIIIDSKNKE